MGTYIIHFDDKPWEDLDDELYYRCFEIPWFSTTKTTISRLTPYTEDSAYAHGYTEAESKYREIRDELEKQAYQRGLADAWDAARKIDHMADETIKEIFGCGFSSVFENLIASECIEKIRQYEQKQEEQIQVGDEVEDGVANLIVLEINQDGTVSGFDDAGSIIHATPRKKTGRHFPEIAEVLQKMKESDNG